MYIRYILTVIFSVFLLPMQYAWGSRYMEADLDSVGGSSLLVDLVNASPVLILLAFVIFNSRFQNILRFLFLWLGLAWLLFLIGIPRFSMFWLAFGWLFLMFFSDGWVCDPEIKSEKLHKEREILSNKGSREHSLSSEESSRRPPEAVEVSSEKVLDQSVRYKVLIACPSCDQRVRMRLGVGESVYIKCFSCGTGFNHKV